ncbi:natriuretic peptide receptor 2 [Seminavis robusta]|uniref:Natriuretic peptide receptor 2 n=1 Tax=Seminavis robusta TaxID=568900 RepID=A0A9N8DN46_9STRA|nr:natriuretic peptide receptor 2 [Seminavis robusta]|eukprot:Sro218_g090200.1 natriuretic peptide receptor 2 (838) ;mRNA; r:76239-78938
MTASNPSQLACLNDADGPEDYDDEDYNQDVESVAYSNAGTNVTDFGTKNLQKEERETLAKKESQAVSIIRIVVYLVVILVAVTVSLLIYFYTKNDQQQDFEVGFAAYAMKVTESFYDSVERKIGAIHSMSTQITSYAVSTGASFPNVTIPHYELQGANARIQAAGVILYFLPLVTDENRAGWEEYAAANRHWVMEAFGKEIAWKNAQDAKFGLGTFEQVSGEGKEDGGSRMLQKTGTDANALEQVTLEDGYNVRVFGSSGGTPQPLNSGPFLPLWQLTPVLPIINFMNFDMSNHSAVAASLDAAVDSHQIVMSQAHDLKDPNDDTNESESLYNAFLEAGQYRHDAELFEGDPTTNLLYPVFDSFGPNRTLGGLLMTSLYWRLNFDEILPDTAKGITVVLENSLNQSFTYRIDGPHVTFLGPGDRHDPRYDSMVVSEDVTEHLQARAGPENQGFDAADLNAEHCRYKLSVYPSQDTEDEYVNNEPIIFTLIVAGVFLFTSLVFILYDWLVARRQRIVMDKAVQSTAIVSSLYPKQVRDRMFEQERNDTSKQDNQWRRSVEKESRVDKLASLNDSIKSDTPIADSYEACTVLFADLSGFTKFSASRKPEDVFYLLETLYQAFDKIATRRKVFKVETIGDCYVACTGLPEAQPNHAVIMIKFARDCYSKMSQLLPLLAEKLGPDTETLSFRVGLHSGPVTGGVLRGQKSRFQLFGDTINTASRMESLGIAGRIHISQATADELTSKGFGRWVVPREDKVEAKGKGEMQTYFVSVQDAAKSFDTTVSVDTFMANESATLDESDQRQDSSCVENRLGNQSPLAPCPEASNDASAMLKTDIEI